MEYYLFPSLNKLKQTIEQVSTAPNSLLYAPSSASEDKVTKNNLEKKDIAEYQIYVRRLYISKEEYTVVAKIILSTSPTIMRLPIVLFQADGLEYLMVKRVV